MEKKYNLEYIYYKNVRVPKKEESQYIVLPDNVKSYLRPRIPEPEIIEDNRNNRFSLESEEFKICKETLSRAMTQYNSSFSYSIKDNHNKIIENGIKGEVVDFYDIPNNFQELVIENNMTAKNNPIVIITGNEMHRFEKIKGYKYFVTEDNEFRPMEDVIFENTEKGNNEIQPILQEIIKKKNTRQ